MTRLLDDEMERLTDDEAEQLWHEMELAAIAPPKTTAERIRPWAIGATAAAAVLIAARQLDRRSEPTRF